MLDPRFQHVAEQYQVLRAQFDAGALDGPAFEAALRGLMIEDEGRYWHIGAASGRWFVSDGDRWVEAEAPEVGPPAAEPEALPGAGAPHPSPPARGRPAAGRHAAPGRPAHAGARPPRPAVAPAVRSGGGTAMAGWGVTLIVLGLGSFILPLVGMQFRLLALFGPAQNIVALGLAALGVILLILSRTRGPSRPAAAGQPAAARPRHPGRRRAELHDRLQQPSLYAARPRRLHHRLPPRHRRGDRDRDRRLPAALAAHRGADPTRCRRRRRPSPRPSRRRPPTARRRRRTTARPTRTA